MQRTVGVEEGNWLLFTRGDGGVTSIHRVVWGGEDRRREGCALSVDCMR